MEQVWYVESLSKEIEYSVNDSPSVPAITTKYHESETEHYPTHQPQNIQSLLDNGNDPNQNQSNYISSIQKQVAMSASHASGENDVLPTSSNNYYSTTVHYDAQQHHGTPCTSFDCATKREHLQLRISELSGDYQLLAESNKAKRDALREKELALGVAQDFSKRLQADLSQEISDMRNTIWRLESESSSLKTEKDGYKCMLIRLKRELLQIDKKIDELCESDDSRQGRSDVNGVYINENSFNSSVNEGQVIADTVSKINVKLNNALHHKQLNNSAICFQKPITPANEMNPLLSSFPFPSDIPKNVVHQNEELYFRHELSMKPPQEICSPSPMCMEESINKMKPTQNAGSFKGGANEIIESGGIAEHKNVNENQICINRVEENQITSQMNGDDDDDDVTIIAEIKKNLPTDYSSSSGVNDGELISSHSTDYTTPDGLLCTDEDESRRDDSERHETIVPHQSFGDEQSLSCVICNNVFSHPQEFDRHMRGIHQIIVFDSCKLCGKMFQSKKHLANHQRTMHVAQKDAIDRVIQPFGAMSNIGPHQILMDSAETLGLANNQSSRMSESECLSLEFNPLDESVTLLPYSQSVETTATMSKWEKNKISATTTSNFLPESPFSHFSDDNQSQLDSSSSYVIEEHGLYQQRESPQARHGYDASKSLPGNFVWCICGSKYSKKASLQVHIRGQTRTQRPTNFVCGSCKKVFSSFNGAKSHIKVCSSLGFRK